MTTVSGEAWYVYCVLPNDAGVPDAPAIIPHARLELLRMTGLALLASRVQRGLFDQADAGNRTADPDLMAQRLQAHHGVNAQASAAGPCLPLHFGVLFSNCAILTDWLARHERGMRAALGHVAGRAEWSVSLHEDVAAHAAWLEQSTPRLLSLGRAVAAAGPGMAFLKSKALQAARAAARDDHIRAAADRVSARLTDTGFDVMRERPRQAQYGWSVLAPKAAYGGAHWPACLEPVADALAPAGLQLHLSGPWPAYALARSVLSAGPAHG